MNKELEQEAEEYENSFGNGVNGTESTDFIVGATSNYVQKEKIKYTLKTVKDLLCNVNVKSIYFKMFSHKIKELQKQLNELT